MCLFVWIHLTNIKVMQRQKGCIHLSAGQNDDQITDMIVESVCGCERDTERGACMHTVH